jgi:hypothetical protein
MKREAPAITLEHSEAPERTDGGSCTALLDAAVEECVPVSIRGIVIGTLAGLSQSGAPLVDFPENTVGRALLARSTVAVGEDQVGQDIALMFENGDARRPIVIGLIHNPAGTTSHRTNTARVDGERVVLTAEKEIELRCGEASITLTKAGKILIRGKYVLSRSSGLNRIKGAAIELN